MNNTIAANDLKTKGIRAISEVIEVANEAIISLRGKNKFVVIPIETYNYLRECELESALTEAKRDLENGNFVEESVEKHIERITRE
ncbi:hypothetical protein MNBD_IGNAVI01-1717 [hydrothermal vent metagenome]|uniref:Prevent-host-death protein n=1 Tax=hydrothermal vent metagenome TaxID=652676 RepID=A0A3B1BX94_9ZZZZ